jgi:ligand-binding sensor domain-containing protein
VAFYDGTSWEIWATDDQLGGNEVDAILQDGGGALWFTHPGSGLSRYDPTDDDWQTFGEDEGALDWPSGGVDTDGRIWIGGYGEIKRYDGRTWQSFTPAQLAEVTVYIIAFGHNDVQWLWTDAGLMRHDLATDEWTTFTAADHSALEEVNALFVADDGTLWVGGAGALVGYDGSSWSIPTAGGDPPEYVSDIAEAPDGSLWVAADGALYHLDGDRWIHFSWPGDGWIERVAAGPDGIIWAGHDGLGRFDPSSGAWQIFTPADGLVHHWVEAIYTTPEGVVWVGTGGGVSRYVPGE